MPWGRIDDRLAMSAKIRGLTDDGATGERAKQQRCESLGAWVQILSWVSGERSDGFVPADVVELFGRPQAVARLLRARFGKAPLLHRREDDLDCECITGREWPADFDFLIHDFLGKNPSRAENDREKAKRADRRDARLKQLVYERDGGCCRYCRSGPLSPKAVRAKDRRKSLSYDHVDPDQPASPDGEGYVTSCGRCNPEKGERTPEEADMILLPAPTGEQKRAWAARGLALFDRPLTLEDDPATLVGSATQSPTDQQQITDPITDPVTDDVADREHDQERQHTGEVRPEQDEQPLRSATSGTSRSLGPGRGGPPAADDSAAAAAASQPARSNTSPDIYHQRSRQGPARENPPRPERPPTQLPTPPAFISAEPEWPPVWPPGSVPASPAAPED